MTVTAYSVNRRAELTVSDEGPGIPQRVQGRIFERFYTADSGGRLGARPGDRPRARAADARGGSRSPRASASPPSRSTCRRPRAGVDAAAPAAETRRRARERAERPAGGAAGAGAGARRAAAARRRWRRLDDARRRPPPTRRRAAGDRADRRATASTPAEVYREAAPGVVTIRSIFDARRAAEGSGFVARHRRAGSSPTPTSSPTTRAATREPAKAVFVEFPDRNVVPAEIVGFDPFADVALLEVEPERASTCTRWSSATTRTLVVGQPVAAIGSPFGEQQSLSVGIVSATDRSVDSLTQFQIEGAIQTDASINPGNSGGPLLDAAARVVGINQQIETNSGANDGVGFAVPISAVKRSIAQLEARRQGRIRLHRRLHPGALPAARREARPRRRLRRPARRSRPRRPGRRGGAGGRRRAKSASRAARTAPAAT